MQRILKIIGLGAATLILVFIVAAGLALTLIKPNEYKPQLESLALKASGRTLILQGDLSLSVFPRISVKAGPAQLHDEASFGPEPFVRVEKISADVALLPLLSGKVEIAEISLSGLNVKLAVDKAGKSNWETQKTPQDGGITTAPLPADEKNSSAGGKSLSALRINSLSLADAVITYTDMRSSKALRVALPTVRLDNLAPGEKTTLTAKARYADDAAAQHIALDLQTVFTLPASLAQNTTFSLSGTLDKTEFSGKGSAALRAKEDNLMLSGEFSLGDLDLDPYLAAVSNATKESPKDASSSSPPARRPSDVAKDAAKDEEELARSLRGLTLDLALKAKSITISRVPLRTIEARVKADKGLISLSPVTFNLADGSVEVKAAADARGTLVTSRSSGLAQNVKTGPIIKAVSGQEAMTGTARLNWEVTGAGLSWPVLSRSLDGKAAMALTEGRVPGFHIIPESLPGLPAQRVDISIEQLTASWTIAKGIARNADLHLKGTPVTATGDGVVSIPDQTLNYRIKAQLPALPVVPAVISGPLASPRYSVDKVEFLRGTAVDLLESPGKAGQELEKAGQGIGKAVEDLFKRKR